MKVDDFRKENPREMGGAHAGAHAEGRPSPASCEAICRNQEQIVWFHPRYANSEPDRRGRADQGRNARQGKNDPHLGVLQKNIPGFEDSFIVLSCPQLGTRGAGGCSATTW